MADCALIPQQDTSTLECTIPTHLHSSLTLALNHDAHTLDYPTLAYDLGAPAPNHAHTTTTRSRCAHDSVMCTAQGQDRGTHRPRPKGGKPPAGAVLRRTYWAISRDRMGPKQV